ncbi:MAG: hypothetical protein H5T40_05060 [Methanobacteriales archaeon]|nr:hypothetical protein [Methanobacteriales archaeon]
MDERGFIFTTDATLALVIFFILTTSILTYYILPAYMGSDHQRLEAMAADTLEIMRQDGTLYAAAIKYAAGNQSAAQAILQPELESLIPPDTGYKLTIGPYPPVADDRGIGVPKDVASRAIVISGPREGWLGRAWYKIEEIRMEDQRVNSTTTLWNFHNWLTNFDQWSGGLRTCHYWGGGSSPTSIPFTVPSNDIIWGKFLLGSCNKNNGPSYGATVYINGQPYNISNSSFTFLNVRPGTSPSHRMYNYQGNISNLVGGSNNFYVDFQQMNQFQSYDMPWFSILANYTTTIKVPKGIITRTFTFNDAAGLAVPNAQDLDGDGQANEYGRIYDLQTGSLSNLNSARIIAWNSMVGQNHSYSDGQPFVITNVNGENGCAVSVVQDIDIPAGSRIFDAYTVINPYGGVDNALVEVWNGTAWNVAFCSFDYGGVDYSARGDGYGNVPGIIYIRDYLRAGRTNKVRITIWDQVPGNDYDLVGLVDCYSTVSYSALPIQWQNFPFPSYQNSTNTTAPISTFTIGPDAQRVILFLGTGLDTRNVSVEVRNSTSGWVQLYSGPPQFAIDIGSIDVMGSKIFTKSGTPENYTTKPGNYYIRVTVKSSASWESGDIGGTSGIYQSYSNAEIYSGTRVAVIYPKFLANMWASAYADDAYVAQAMARQNLIDMLEQSGYIVDPNLIKTEALYTGNLPNALPVRLDLWRD